MLNDDQVARAERIFVAMVASNPMLGSECCDARQAAITAYGAAQAFEELTEQLQNGEIAIKRSADVFDPECN